MGKSPLLPKKEGSFHSTSPTLMGFFSYFFQHCEAVSRLTPGPLKPHEPEPSWLIHHALSYEIWGFPSKCLLMSFFFFFQKRQEEKQAPEQQVGSKRRTSIIQYGTSLCAPVYTCMRAYAQTQPVISLQ